MDPNLLSQCLTGLHPRDAALPGLTAHGLGRGKPDHTDMTCQLRIENPVWLIRRTLDSTPSHAGGQKWQ